MSVATSSNFIEGNGTIDDPFQAGARPLTLAEQAAVEEQKRQQRNRERAASTANVNNSGYHAARRQDVKDSLEASNQRVEDSRRALGFDPHKGNQRGFLGNLARDPVTMGILAAPYGVVGAGLAVGGAAGLGFGEAAGAGSIAGGGEAIVPVANEATGLATAGPGFSAEAANAYNAAAATNAVASGTTATAAGTTAGATAPAGGLSAGDAFMKYGMPALQTLAPLGIQALTGGRTKEEKALLAKQEQMAKEAEARRFQVQESRMNALGQQMLAMNPRNQMMAKMFGPDAAFAPTDFAQMVQNPVPPPQMPPELQALAGKNTKNTPQQEAALRAFAQQKQQYEQGNQARSDQMMNGMAPPGPGPAPLDPRKPQPARRY